jgi:hypothetical protein
MLDAEVPFLSNFNLNSIFLTSYISVLVPQHEYQPALSPFTSTKFTVSTFFYSYIFCLSCFISFFSVFEIFTFYLSFLLVWAFFLTLIISSISAFDP